MPGRVGPGSGGDVARLGGSRSGQRPLTADTTALTLAHATPDAELLAVLQGVLEAVLSHDTAPADLLGLPGGSPALGEEEVGVDAQTVGEILPGLLFGFGFVVERHENLRHDNDLVRPGPPASCHRCNYTTVTLRL